MTDTVPFPPDVANSLALAVIASSLAPLVMLDGDLRVVLASASFCRDFEIDPKTASGMKLQEPGNGEWNVRQLGVLLRATAAGKAEISSYEMDLIRDGHEPRRLAVNAHKLEYAGSEGIRLVVAVADVTAARLAEKIKDDLLREKAILMQELQHRVANSLQIVASVLLLSARRVQSEETRTHLHDAHHRVMSVAAMQKHLSVSTLGDVALHSYFTDLCDSIGASMIRDHNQLSIAVDVDDSMTSADVSVSLGLIVTQLVINALKHAFPDGREGKISVGYHAKDSAWTLSVADDGVGMPEGDFGAKPGLGTGIVEALAKQLDAVVRPRDLAPGTEVAVVHA